MAAYAGNGMARMIPIDFVHAPSPQKPRPGADMETCSKFRQAKREMALPRVAANRLLALRNNMDADGQSLRDLWTVVDGGYTNRTLLKHLPPRTVVIGRIRGDAKLYHLPDAANSKIGRRRVYGRRAPTPKELRQDESTPWESVEAFASGKTHLFKIKTLGPLRWRSAGKVYDLRLVVIAPLGYRLTKRTRVLYRQPAYLICTDPNANLRDALQTYLWRMDIEVNFRDEKTLLGVGQAQVRHQHSVANVPVLSVASYAMLLTSALEAYGLKNGPNNLPPPKWYRKKKLRPSTQLLRNHLRHEIWARAIRFSDFVTPSSMNKKPEKFNPSLESALFYATG
jgi:hypothetical protein